MASFKTFTQNLMILAQQHQVPIRQFNQGVILAYADGNDQACFSPEPELLRLVEGKGSQESATQCFERFQTMNGHRAAVIAGFRRFVHGEGLCLERTETGVWRCGTPDQWQFFFMDYRLTNLISEEGPQEALSRLVAILGGEATLSSGMGEITDLPFPQEPEGVVEQLPSVGEIMARFCQKQPGLVQVVAGIHQLASNLVALDRSGTAQSPSVFPPVVDPERRERCELSARELIADFQKNAMGSGKTPHWTWVWRQHCQNGYWVKPEIDHWAPRSWWVEVAQLELRRMVDADVLSAYELLLRLGAHDYRSAAIEEVEAWHKEGSFDVESFAPLLGFFYPDHPLARSLFDRAESRLNTRFEHALVTAGHYPTLRRVADAFQADWEACCDRGGFVEDDWVLEHDSFRQMGPTWAVSFLGMESVGKLQDACCQAALRMKEGQLVKMMPHLLCWSADFAWPDVLSHLRANAHFNAALAADKKHIAIYALIWSLVRPDSFTQRLAAYLLEQKNPLQRFAGAVSWLRCRDSNN